MARTIHISNKFHGPKEVRAIEVRLYVHFAACLSADPGIASSNPSLEDNFCSGKK